jgi:hypothetical protein
MSVQKNASEADLREAHTRSILLSPSVVQLGDESGFQKARAIHGKVGINILDRIWCNAFSTNMDTSDGPCRPD